MPDELKAAAEQAAAAIAQFEQAHALAAVRTIREKQVPEARAVTFFRAHGHLFDTRIFNRLLDIIVDSPCQFEILDLQVPTENELPSTAFLKVWSEDSHQVAALTLKMGELVAAEESGVVVEEIDRQQVPRKLKGQL